MSKRLATLTGLLAATALLAVLPAASAQANSPWWHLDTGSRPTDLWAPVSESQELQAAAVGSLTVVKVKGTKVACMGSALCSLAPPVGPGLPNSETAAQLQTALEVPAAYGPGGISVTESPASSRHFTIASIGPMAGRWVPPLETETGGSAKVLTEGGSGHLVLTITNVGDAPVAAANPVTIADHLPAGVVAYNAEAYVASHPGASAPILCNVAIPGEVSCTISRELPQFEAIEVEIFASVDPASVGAPGSISVSGGGAPAKSATQSLVVKEGKTPFGVQSFSMRTEEEGGTPATQAGSHPFQVTQSLQFNVGPMTPGERVNAHVEQAGQPRNVRVKLPPGLTGNPRGLPTCSFAQFTQTSLAPKFGFSSCPDETAIGVASVTVIDPALLKFARIAVPIFNLEPVPGEPARFGFSPIVPVTIDTALLNDEAYAVSASVNNASQTVQVLAATVTLWGKPGDPKHDESRGWGCVWFNNSASACERPPSLGERAFLRQPVSCASPLDYGLQIEPWGVPFGSVVSSATDTSVSLLGCNKVPFDPSIASTTTSKLTTSPSGLDFELALPNSGLENIKDGAIAEAEPKKVEVDLPEGVTANPSQAEGLAVCTPADFAREKVNSKSGEGCPEASKIGSVVASTPLIEEAIEGSLYIAAPHDNPFDSLLALYLVARAPERGVLVKQAGIVEPDPRTGQLRTTFDQLPQQPYSTFKLHFREGGRAPLVTPPTCGTYDTLAKFVPWSAANPENPDPSEVVNRLSSSTIERGVNGGACPNGTPPFHPGLIAGSTNNAAGHYSPFNIRIFRDDSEQEITHFSIKLPPGITGKLAGIPFCSDAQVAAAEGREHDGGGAEEQRNPSCPAASEIGRTLVGAGVGSVLTYVPGKLYLAGPYNGSQLSIVSVTSAVVGPFDVGTVVVREGLKINPETAEVFIDATGSDPIPHIIDGIPVHLRDIRAYTDRPEFTLNPTSCEPTSTASTVLGSGTDFASEADDQPVTVTSRYQAADCANLGFKPNLKLSLKGGTKRGKNPALRATLLPRAGDANSARVSVQLPHSEFLDQSHIRTVCTRVQFKAGAGNGAECPAGAIYGHARAFSPLLAEPLEGPVFLRSSEHPLPDLVLAMHGLFDFDAVGRIDSVQGGIRNTFDFVPDAPITKVVLTMQGGKKGLLVNSTNICKGKHKAIAKFTAHNGKLHNFNPALTAKCPKGKKQKKQKRHARAAG